MPMSPIKLWDEKIDSDKTDWMSSTSMSDFNEIQRHIPYDAKYFTLIYNSIKPFQEVNNNKSKWEEWTKNQSVQSIGTFYGNAIGLL